MLFFGPDFRCNWDSGQGCCHNSIRSFWLLNVVLVGALKPLSSSLSPSENRVFIEDVRLSSSVE